MSPNILLHVQPISPPIIFPRLPLTVLPQNSQINSETRKNGEIPLLTVCKNLETKADNEKYRKAGV